MKIDQSILMKKWTQGIVGTKHRFGMSKIQWEPLTEMDQIHKIHNDSINSHILIFKYSNRCGISDMVLSRLERSWHPEEMTHVRPYFLDLITYRDISNQIAEQYGVRHESPQLLLIKDQKLSYHTSHMGINYSHLKEKIK